MDSGRRTLGHELKKLQKVQATTPLHELGWYIDFNSIENLFHWIVELHSFDPMLPLARDMKSAGARSVVLELRFGRSFPLSPPFVRVIRPRFLPFMAGGGGHVTNGGAMCMELLTNSGWSPATSLENVLVQVRMSMSSEDPQPARLEYPLPYRTRVSDYGIDEAIAAFRRSALAHGWEVPSDFEETARLA
ncbi:Ubiquitin-conjugating enzyme E2Q-like protein like [Verticillium longisporum]|uniref:Ubiquitin-conjugating enzyme E2Q-like protein like n=2 Tax=Verticillium longisporum TaxID=100787 RepID=A0A8I3ATE0_VERLO|nr:Ubiquitin-conjugating enzyme E2Q-like protein like [Verticillium longisporum]